MKSIDGFILAGGESRRMGTDKSRLTIAGQSFIQRIAEEVGASAASVTVIGNNSASLPGELPVNLSRVADVFPGWGALGGVHAALSACQQEWALIVACDFPFVTRRLFNRLASLREDFEAVAPIQSDLIPQPLCALYRVVPCLAHAEQMIKSGERKPIALLQFVNTRWINFDQISDLEDAARFFDNINTPDDYARITGERN
jgi:molybdopterin-guanine dinucleotide biosynthesis protein A